MTLRFVFKNIWFQWALNDQNSSEEFKIQQNRTTVYGLIASSVFQTVEEDYVHPREFFPPRPIDKQNIFQANIKHWNFTSFHYFWVNRSRWKNEDKTKFKSRS